MKLIKLIKYGPTFATGGHKGKKPFKCDICDNSSSQKNQMNRHIVSVHKEK